MGNVLDKRCRENKNAHFAFSNFFSENCTVSDNSEKCGGFRRVTNDVTMWRMRVACWISKATFTYSHAHAHSPG
jgi:hypothetical protein